MPDDDINTKTDDQSTIDIIKDDHWDDLNHFQSKEILLIKF